jgi:hypothetical protein
MLPGGNLETSPPTPPSLASGMWHAFRRMKSTEVVRLQSGRDHFASWTDGLHCHC